ncbi:MAG: CopD family protein [Gemmatimonadota bacterium]|nr:CopD family protein [Gemmatimonadota bacterium]
MTIAVLGVVSRWVVFTGLLVAIGALTFDMWILRPERSAAPAREGAASGSEGADLPDGARVYAAGRAAAALAALAVALVLLGALGRLAAELAIFRDPFEPWRSELDLLVTGTSFGTAWMWQAGLAVLAFAAFALASRSPAPMGGGAAWLLALAATLALAVTPAFSGHAAGSAELRGLAISSDVVHVVAGGVWLGTLAIVASVAAGARRRGLPIGRDRLIGWVTRFSPLALVCAATLGVTGVVASWLHLDAVSSLWRTPYGRLLLVKVGVLFVILGFGAYNWKQSRGRIALSGDPARLPKSVAAELAAGLVILLVTAVLVTTPPPGE